MKSLDRIILPSILGAHLVATAAGAEIASATVELTSSSGEVVLLGGIAAVNEQTGVVDSAFGNQEFRFSDMNCVGQTCSQFEGWANSSQGALSQVAFQPERFAGLQSRFGIERTAQSIGTDVSAEIMGLSAWTIITSGDTGVSAISVDELAAIYAGDIVNWSALGGNDQPIVALKREPSSNESFELNSMIWEASGQPLGANVLNTRSVEDLRHYVDALAGSIAVVELADAGGLDQMSITDQCGRPVVAGEFEVRSGAYPMLRPMYASVELDTSPSSGAAIVDVSALAPSVDMFEDVGLILDNAVWEDPAGKAVRLAALSEGNYEGAQGEAAQEMLSLMFTARRLSTTFIGDPQTEYDRLWNERAMLRLIEGIYAGVLDGGELTFVGFSTEGEDFDLGLEQSATAAQQVLAAFGEISHTAPVEATAHSFGNFPEIACIHGASATLVEVWVR